MEKPTVKYVLTEDYKRLRPLRSIGGPSMGPMAPMQVPVHIIRECLQQPEAPTLKEVLLKEMAYGNPVWSEPVVLTMANYDQPYSVIMGVEPVKEVVEAPVNDAAPAPADVAPAVEDQATAPAENVEEEKTEETQETAPVEVEKTEEAQAEATPAEEKQAETTEDAQAAAPKSHKRK